ncbi:hypothetical protein ACLOJK_021486 [Asimina triloba]
MNNHVTRNTSTASDQSLLERRGAAAYTCASRHAYKCVILPLYISFFHIVSVENVFEIRD